MSSITICAIHGRFDSTDGKCPECGGLRRLTKVGVLLTHTTNLSRAYDMAAKALLDITRREARDYPDKLTSIFQDDEITLCLNKNSTTGYWGFVAYNSHNEEAGWYRGTPHGNDESLLEILRAFVVWNSERKQ